MTTKNIEKHPLEPFLPADAKLLMLGSFPPPRERWTMDFYYPNFQNDMWRIFGIVFFDDKDYFVVPEKKSFDESLIKKFLTEKGIALYDTAIEVIRKKNNASDMFLEIVKPVNIQKILSQIPHCKTIVTTGQKATEELTTLLGIEKIPLINEFKDTRFNGRQLHCYRMPSSSRAYPKSLADKATDYKEMFEATGFI